MMLQTGWDRFAWGDVRLPGWLTVFYCCLAILVPLSYTALLRRSPPTVDRRLVCLLWATLALNLLGVVRFSLQFTGSQGRYLYPSIAAIVVLMAIAVDRLSSDLPANRRWIIPVGLGACSGWIGGLCIDRRNCASLLWSRHAANPPRGSCHRRRNLIAIDSSSTGTAIRQPSSTGPQRSPVRGSKGRRRSQPRSLRLPGICTLRIHSTLADAEAFLLLLMWGDNLMQSQYLSLACLTLLCWTAHLWGSGSIFR